MTASVSHTFSLPTGTASLSLSLPTATLSVTLPTLTASSTMSLPTATASATASHSVTTSFTLPTASATFTTSLSETFTESLTFTYTRMTFDNYTSYIEPTRFRSGQEVRVKVVTKLLEEEIRAINASDPLGTDFIVFKHNVKYDGRCAGYVQDMDKYEVFFEQRRREEMDRELWNSDKRNVRRERTEPLQSTAFEQIHVISRGYGSALWEKYDDFSETSPYVSTFRYTFAVPHHSVDFVVCYQHRPEQNWKLRSDQIGWQLLYFDALKSTVLRAERSQLYYHIPDATSGQYAIIQLLSREEGFNFTYAASTTCGVDASDAAVLTCSEGDLLKIVPKSAPCSSERLFHEKDLRYLGTNVVLPDGTLSMHGVSAIRESATEGGVGLFGTQFANPLLDKWSSPGVYSGNAATKTATHLLNANMYTVPTHSFPYSAYVYVRLPKVRETTPNSTYLNEYDICYSSLEDRRALLTLNTSVGALPLWRKLYQCSPYHAECTREHDPAHVLSSGTTNRDTRYAEFNPSFVVSEENVGWTMFDLSPQSWGTVVFDSGAHPILNTRPHDIFNKSYYADRAEAAAPQKIQNYWDPLGGDMFRIVPAAEFREHENIYHVRKEVNMRFSTLRNYGTFPSTGCWSERLDHVTNPAFAGEGVDKGDGVWRSSHGGFADEGAEYPIGSKNLRGDPTLPRTPPASRWAKVDQDNQPSVSTAFATLYVPDEHTKWFVCYRVSCTNAEGKDSAAYGCQKHAGMRVLPFHGEVNKGIPNFRNFPKGVLDQYPQKKWLHYSSEPVTRELHRLAPLKIENYLNTSVAYANEGYAAKHPPRYLYWSMNDTRSSTYGPITLRTVNNSYYEGGFLDSRKWNIGAVQDVDATEGSVLRLVHQGEGCEHDGGLHAPADNPFHEKYFLYQRRFRPAAEQTNGGTAECNSLNAISPHIKQCYGRHEDNPHNFEVTYYIHLPPVGHYRVCHRTRGWNWVELATETHALSQDILPNIPWGGWGNGTRYDYLHVAEDAKEHFSVQHREVRGGMEALFLVEDALGRSAVGKRGHCNTADRGYQCEASADVFKLVPSTADGQPDCEITPMTYDAKLTDNELSLYCADGLTSAPCSTDPMVVEHSTFQKPTPYVDLLAQRTPLIYRNVVPFRSEVYHGVYLTAASLFTPKYIPWVGTSPNPNQFSICYKQQWAANWVVLNQTFEIARDIDEYALSYPVPSTVANDTTGHLLAGRYQTFELRLYKYLAQDIESFAAKLVEFHHGSTSNNCLQRPAHTEGELMSSATSDFFRGKADHFVNFRLTVPAHPGRYILCIQAKEKGRLTENSMSWYRVRKYPSLAVNDDYSYYVRDNGIRWFVREGNGPTNQGVLTVNIVKCQSVHTPFSTSFTKKQGAFACAKRTDGGVFNTDDSVANPKGDVAKVIPYNQPCNDTTAHVGVEGTTANGTSPNNFRQNLGPTDGPASAATFVVALPPVAYDTATTYKVCIRTHFAETDIIEGNQPAWVEAGQYYSAAGLQPRQLFITGTSPTGSMMSMFRAAPSAVMHWSTATAINPPKVLVNGSMYSSSVVSCGVTSDYVGAAGTATPGVVASHGFTFSMYPLYTPAPPTGAPPTPAPTTAAPLSAAPGTAVPAVTSAPPTPAPPTTPVPPPPTSAPLTVSPYASRTGRYDLFKLVLVKIPKTRLPETASWGNVATDWTDVPGASCLSDGVSSNEPPCDPASGTQGECPSVTEIDGEGTVAASVQFPLVPGKYLVCYKRAHPDLGAKDQTWMWIRSAAGDSGLYVQPSFLEMEVDVAAMSTMLYDLRTTTVLGNAVSLGSWCAGGNTTLGTAGYGGNDCEAVHGTTGYVADLLSIVDGEKGCRIPNLAPSGSASSPPEWFRLKRASVESSAIDTTLSTAFTLPPAAFPSLKTYKLCVYKALSPASNKDAGGTSLTSTDYVLNEGVVYQLYNRGVDRASGGLSGLWKPTSTTSGGSILASSVVDNTEGNADPYANILADARYNIEFNKSVVDAFTVVGAFKPYSIQSGVTLTYTLAITGGNVLDSSVVVERCALSKPSMLTHAVLYCDSAVPLDTNASADVFLVHTVDGTCSVAKSPLFGLGTSALTQKYVPDDGTLRVTIKYASACGVSEYGCGIRFKTRDRSGRGFLSSSPYYISVAKREPDTLALNGGSLMTWTCFHNEVCKLRFQAMYQGLLEFAPVGNVVVRAFVNANFAVNSAVNDLALEYGPTGTVEYLSLPRLLVGIDASFATLRVSYGTKVGSTLLIQLRVARRGIKSALFGTIVPALGGATVDAVKASIPPPTWVPNSLAHSYLLTTCDYVIRIHAFAEDGKKVVSADDVQGWVISAKAPTRNAVLIAAADVVPGPVPVDGSPAVVPETLPPLEKRPLQYDADGVFVKFRMKNNYGCYRGVGCRLAWSMEKQGMSVVTVYVDVAVRVVGDRVRVTPASATTYRMQGIPVTLDVGQYISADEWIPDEFHESAFYAQLHDAPGVSFLPDTTQQSSCVFTNPCVPSYEKNAFVIKTNASCANCTASFHTTAGAESFDETAASANLKFTLLEPIMGLDCGIETPNITFAQDSPLSSPFNLYVAVVSRLTGAMLTSDLIAVLDVSTLDNTGYSLVSIPGPKMSLSVENGRALIRNAVLKRDKKIAVATSIRMYVEGPRGTSCDKNIILALGDVKVNISPLGANDEVHLTTSQLETGVDFTYAYSDGVERLLQIQVNNEPIGWALNEATGLFVSPSAALSSTYNPWKLPTFGGVTFTYGSAVLDFTTSTDKATKSGTFRMKYAGNVASPVRLGQFEVCGGVETCKVIKVSVVPDIIPPLSLQWYSQPPNLLSLTSSCSQAPVPNAFEVGVVYTVPNDLATMKYIHYTEPTRVVLSHTRIVNGKVQSNSVYTEGNVTDTAAGIATIGYSGPRSGFSDRIKLESASIGSSVTVDVTWATVADTYNTFELLPSVQYAECPRTLLLNATAQGYRTTIPAETIQGKQWAYQNGVSVGVPSPFQSIVLTNEGTRAWSFQGKVRLTKMPSHTGCNDGGTMTLFEPNSLDSTKFAESASGLSDTLNGVSTAWVSFSAPCESCTLRLDLCYTTATTAANCLTPPSSPTAADNSPLLSNRLKYTKPFSVKTPRPSGAHITHQSLPASEQSLLLNGRNVSVVRVGTGFAITLEAVQQFGPQGWAAAVADVPLEVKVLNVWRPEGGAASLRYGNGGFLRELLPSDALQVCGGVLRETHKEYSVRAKNPTLNFVYTRPCSLCEVWIHTRVPGQVTWSSFPLLTAARSVFQTRVTTCGSLWALAPSTPQGRFRNRPFSISIWKLDQNGFPAWEGEERMLFSIGDSNGNGGGGVIRLEGGHSVEGMSTLVLRGVGTVLVSATRACFRCSASLNSKTQSVFVPFSVMTHATHLVAYKRGKTLVASDSNRPVWFFDIYAADDNGDRDFTMNGQVTSRTPVLSDTSTALMVNGAMSYAATVKSPVLNVGFKAVAVRDIVLNTATQTYVSRPPYANLSWSTPFYNMSVKMDSACGAQSGTLQEGIACTVRVLSNGRAAGLLSSGIDGAVVSASGGCPCGSLAMPPIARITHGRASFGMTLTNVSRSSCECHITFVVQGAGVLAQRLGLAKTAFDITSLIVTGSAAQVVNHRIVDPVMGAPTDSTAYVPVLLNQDIRIQVGGFDVTKTQFINKTLPARTSLKLLPASCFKQTSARVSGSVYEFVGTFKAACRVTEIELDGALFGFIPIDVRVSNSPRTLLVNRTGVSTLRVTVQDRLQRAVEYYSTTTVALEISSRGVPHAFIAKRGVVSIDVAEVAALMRDGGFGTPPANVDGVWRFLLSSGVSSPTLPVTYVPIAEQLHIQIEKEQVPGNAVQIRILVLDRRGNRVDTPTTIFIAENAVPCTGFPLSCAQRLAVSSLTSAKLLHNVEVFGEWRGYFHLMEGGVHPVLTKTAAIGFTASSTGYRATTEVMYRVFASLRIVPSCLSNRTSCDFTVYLMDDTGGVLLGDRGSAVAVRALCLSDLTNQTIAGPYVGTGLVVNIPDLATTKGVATLPGMQVSTTCEVLEVTFTLAAYTGRWTGRIDTVPATTPNEVVFGSISTNSYATEFEAISVMRILTGNTTALSAVLKGLVKGAKDLVVERLCVMRDGEVVQCQSVQTRRAVVLQAGVYETALMYKAVLFNRVDPDAFMTSLEVELVNAADVPTSPLNSFGVSFNASSTTSGTTRVHPVPPSAAPPTPLPTVPTVAPLERPVTVRPFTRVPDFTAQPTAAPTLTPFQFFQLSASALPGESTLWMLWALTVTACLCV